MKTALAGEGRWRGRPWAAAAALALLTALALRWPRQEPVRLEIGAFEAPYREGAWSRSGRAGLDPGGARDEITEFYFRSIPPTAGFALPFIARGNGLAVTVRASTRLRSAVAVYLAGEAMGEVLVRPGPWDRYTVETSRAKGRPIDVSLALRPLPLVRGDHVDRPEVYVDFVEVKSTEGLVLSGGACLLAAAGILAVFTAARVIGFGPTAALAASAAGALLLGASIRFAPLPTLAALPRLLPLALAAGGTTAWILRRANLDERDRRGLAALVVLGTLAHGAVVFFPDHNPPDIDIHARRTRDLGAVPFEYDALLRYGSQLPTASQDQGAATAALGERTLIPYSPLPYVAYYVLHRLGLDLYWAMTGFNAALAMAAAPVLWLCGRRLWGREAGWLAALLYTFDLAVWHHLGRSHAPAVFGGALGTAALAALAAYADRLERPRTALAIGGALGLAVLGYSSLVVLIGLFGAVLLILLVTDARGLSPAGRRGLATVLVTGGLIAGVLFYFHYVPGMLRGASSVEAEPDLFPGKTYLIFHNESRQSLRLWVLGLVVPFAAGLLAAPIAIRRALPAARPVLVAWIAAWVLVMVLKEPFLYPKLLRWAKEDQFLSPLLCLTIAAAVAALPHRTPRRLAAVLVLATAVWLELRDFRHHAVSLLL